MTESTQGENHSSAGSTTTTARDRAPQLHQRLLELLPSAHAESCQIVATFLDIRGFSTFSAAGESFDTALYLRSVFTSVPSRCFADADFFKPTGDGLLLVYELTDDAEHVVA